MLSEQQAKIAQISDYVSRAYSRSAHKRLSSGLLQEHSIYKVPNEYRVHIRIGRETLDRNQTLSLILCQTTTLSRPRFFGKLSSGALSTIFRQSVPSTPPIISTLTEYGGPPSRGPSIGYTVVIKKPPGAANSVIFLPHGSRNSGGMAQKNLNHLEQRVNCYFAK
jgi:hypothetical protein